MTNETTHGQIKDGNAFEQVGSVRYYHNLVQGCDEWLQMRLGILTASEIKLLITPATLKPAKNAAQKTHLYELLGQRITNHIDEHFESYDMRRGKLEEFEARLVYNENIAEVKECGFVVNDELGFPIGCSPDGLVGKDGMIEVKSRAAKFQMQTICEHIVEENDDLIPREYMLQVQGGLFVTQRKWCDFLSYSNGLNMAIIRVEPIEEYQTAIRAAAEKVEADIVRMFDAYNKALQGNDRIIPVRRQDYEEELTI